MFESGMYKHIQWHKATFNDNGDDASFGVGEVGVA